MLFLDDLLALPITGFKSILRTLATVAEEQYTDDAPIKERLLHLQVELDEGTISEKQYVKREGEILRELREIQKRKRELQGLPPEEAAGFTGKVKEGSGVELTWDPNSDDNVGPGR